MNEQAPATTAEDTRVPHDLAEDMAYGSKYNRDMAWDERHKERQPGEFVGQTEKQQTEYAEQKEEFVRVLHENPQLESDLRAYLESIGTSLREVSGYDDDEFRLSALLDLDESVLELKLLPRENNLNQSPTSQEMAEKINEGDVEAPIPTWIMNQMDNLFHRNSDEYRALVELQNQDETTVKDIKEFYDDALQGARDESASKIAEYEEKVGKFIDMLPVERRVKTISS